MDNENIEEELKNENLHPTAQYIKCDPDHEHQIALIRFAFSEMYKCFDEILLDSRESSLARTKLEEAQMWAIKSITREKQDILD